MPAGRACVGQLLGVEFLKERLGGPRGVGGIRDVRRFVVHEEELITFGEGKRSIWERFGRGRF